MEPLGSSNVLPRRTGVNSGALCLPRCLGNGMLAPNNLATLNLALSFWSSCLYPVKVCRSRPSLCFANGTAESSPEEDIAEDLVAILKVRSIKFVWSRSY